jgi:hypothetical protein
MKKYFPFIAVVLLPFACSTPDKTEKKGAAEVTLSSPYTQKLAQFKRIDMKVDFSELSSSEKEVLHKLGLAAKVLNRLYLEQVYSMNPDIRKEIMHKELPNKDELIKLFDLHFGPWDTLDNNKPFYGDVQRPKGAGVYPVDLTKEEFNAWIEAHPEDKESFTSLYTVIVREGKSLKAVPYSEYYKKDIEAVAVLLDEASEISENAALKKFLKLRAAAFRTDSYRESEMAWMDLDGRIEVAIGPYEVYTDALFGYKAFFETFITIRNSVESAKLDKYKTFLPLFEKNLPIPDEFKNFNRGSESPLAVVDQVAGGGDCKPGVQTVAFNLPNDEYVREKKGSKKVLLKNVMQAKFNAILEPMSDIILAPEQRDLLDFEFFFLEILFHEMSHGLGPGSIVLNGEPTTVQACLQETYSKIEEGKADNMGMYNLFYMMKSDKNQTAFSEKDKQKLLVTYFAGLFRSMRFGVHEAHGGGAAFQYNFLKENNGFNYDPETGKYTVNFENMEQGLTDLLHEVLMIQAKGDYQAAKAFLEKYANEPEEVSATVAKMESIPVDITPRYPEL